MGGVGSALGVAVVGSDGVLLIGDARAVFIGSAGRVGGVGGVGVVAGQLDCHGLGGRRWTLM